MTKNQIKLYTCEYGFQTLEVTTEEGGRIVVTDYINKDIIEQYDDLGTIHSMSPNGIGAREYIRQNDRKENADYHLKGIDQYVWLNAEEKEAIKNMITMIKQKEMRIKGDQ